MHIFRFKGELNLTFEMLYLGQVSHYFDIKFQKNDVAIALLQIKYPLLHLW